MRRYLACKEAGVEPGFFDVNVPDPWAYSWSLNAHRRHLTESQIAIAANKREGGSETEKAKDRMKAGGKKGGEISSTRVGPRGPRLSSKNQERRATDEIAKKYNVSERTMRRGKKVLDHGTEEVIDAVERGTITVTKADQIDPGDSQGSPQRSAKTMRLARVCSPVAG